MSTPNRPIRLYRDALSGHAHRAQLFLSLASIPFEMIEVPLKTGAHKKPAFLAINPFGQVPVIDDDGVIITDSNAILVYLATQYADSSWLPHDPVELAAVQRWLSVAAGPIANGPASARLVNVFGAMLDLERAQTIAHNLLTLIEAHLTGREFLVGTAPTIADVAGYSYIAQAPEGGISLEPYPQVRGWLARIEALPGFVAWARNAVGLWA